MRYSRQREALLTLLRSTKTHPDAEWLYTGLRKEYPNISLGTVYRNLRQLTEVGEILELCYGSTSHFDGDISPHYHMICSCCRKIYDIPVVLCKRTEVNQWYYGREAIRQAEEGAGTLVEGLFEKARNFR